MTKIKILSGSLPKQLAVYSADCMTVHTSDKGLKSYWMKEATVSVAQISEDKGDIIFDLELRDGEKVQASSSHKVFGALQGFSSPRSTLNYLAKNLSAEDIKKTRKDIIKLFIVGLIVLLTIVKFMFGEPSSSKFSVKTEKLNAYVSCKSLVGNRLKSPRTAKYPLGYKDYVEASEDGNVYTVNSYVDSQNSFGAMIRTPFSCLAFYDKKSGEWTLVNFKLGK